MKHEMLVPCRSKPSGDTTRKKTASRLECSRIVCGERDCARFAAHSLSARRRALANNLKITALRPLGFSSTSPYRSKLLTALHEKSPALCAELQIICGERGIRTPGPVKVNSFQDCRNRPLCHLSIIVELDSRNAGFLEGVQR